MTHGGQQGPYTAQVQSGRAESLLIIAVVGLVVGSLSGAAFLEEGYPVPGILSLMLAHLGGIALIAYLVIKALR